MDRLIYFSIFDIKLFTKEKRQKIYWKIVPKNTK